MPFKMGDRKPASVLLLSQPAWAALTNYYHLGGLDNKYFSQFCTMEVQDCEMKESAWLGSW